MLRGLRPRMSATCSQLSSPLTPRRITSCTRMARSPASGVKGIATSLGQSQPTQADDRSSHVLIRTGHIMCSLQRSARGLTGLPRRRTIAPEQAVTSEGDEMETGLRGKIAMVSGASKGIGRAIAEKLAVEGASLSLCARGAEPLRALARQLEDKHGVSCLVFPGDLNTDEAIRGWVANTTARFGGVDILVNNAGAAQGGPFLDLPDQVWRDSLNLKLFGYI